MFINVLDYGMDIKEVIEELRIFNSIGLFIGWEVGVDMNVKGELEVMGFNFGDELFLIGNV